MSKPKTVEAPKKVAKQKPGRGVVPNAPTILTRTGVALLRRVASGENLFATRNFPFAYMHKITWIRREKHKDPVQVTDYVTSSTVADLIALKLLDAHQSNPMTDFVEYEVTDAGRQRLADGPPKPDDSQLDWVNNGAA